MPTDNIDLQVVEMQCGRCPGKIEEVLLGFKTQYAVVCPVCGEETVVLPHILAQLERQAADRLRLERR